MPVMNAAPTIELPSSRSLFRSTLIAAAVAIVLLVAVVMPAEYGVDPMGVGRLLGLTEMGRIKVALAKEAAIADSVEAAARVDSANCNAATTAAARPPSDARLTVPAASAAAVRGAQASANSHVTEIVLAPGEGRRSSSCAEG